MKTRLSFITAAAAIVAALPTMAFAASVDAGNDWPTWIGRITGITASAQSPARLTSQGPLYLPRSLIRTGKFQSLLEDVRKAKHGTVQTPWPEWVDEMPASGN